MLWDLAAEWQTAIAVVDGAKFNALPRLLASARIEATALILESAPRPAPASGPVMVALDARNLGRLSSIEGMRSACVLWSGVRSPAEAFRHFRRINRVEIAERDHGREAVLFRHWNIETLALVIPILRPLQMAKLFGPFDCLAFCGESDPAPIVVARQSSWPLSPRAPLYFDAGQIDLIEAAMRDRSNHAIGRYLRRNAPHHLSAADDAFLIHHVSDCRKLAGAWGITGEAGIGRFAWLQLTTEGRFARMPEVRALMEAPSRASPEKRLEYLMHVMAQQMMRG